VKEKDKDYQEKPWGGRFKEELDKKVEAFSASLPFDRRLAVDDLKGSMAHCRMLVKTGIIADHEGELILKGLLEIEEEILGGQFTYHISLEDIHMNIEKRLIDKIGPLGGKLHTARSRNDQVALDMHLYVKKEIREVEALIRGLQEVILEFCPEKYGCSYSRLYSPAKSAAGPYLTPFHGLLLDAAEGQGTFWMLIKGQTLCPWVPVLLAERDFP
jgi:argininosuccinate lyase